MGFKPVFTKGLILKQHMLEALRDYPLDYINSLYSDMGDGVISGMEIDIVENGCFCVNRGIVKINGQVYFLDRNIVRSFEERKNFVYLDIGMEDRIDGTEYHMDIVQKKQQDQEMFELFRYVKNADMKYYDSIDETLEDMTNRLDFRRLLKSVKGGSSLCDLYYRLFAKTVLKSSNAGFHDIAFAYQCFNGIASADIIKTYFETEDISNENIMERMKDKIKGFESFKIDNTAKSEKRQERKMIIS